MTFAIHTKHQQRKHHRFLRLNGIIDDVVGAAEKTAKSAVSSAEAQAQQRANAAIDAAKTGTAPTHGQVPQNSAPSDTSLSGGTLAVGAAALGGLLLWWKRR